MLGLVLVHQCGENKLGYQSQTLRSQCLCLCLCTGLSNFHQRWPKKVQTNLQMKKHPKHMVGFMNSPSDSKIDNLRCSAAASWISTSIVATHSATSCLSMDSLWGAWLRWFISRGVSDLMNVWLMTVSWCWNSDLHVWMNTTLIYKQCQTIILLSLPYRQ